MGHSGGFLASWSIVGLCVFDTTVKLWDSAIENLQNTFLYPGALNGVLFSPNGQLLACLESNLGAQLWDIGQGITLSTMVKSGSQSVSFSENGSRLVFSHKDVGSNLFLGRLARSRIKPKQTFRIE